MAESACLYRGNLSYKVVVQLMTRCSKIIQRFFNMVCKTKKTSKQLSTVAAVDSRFDLYHVAVVLSLIFYAVSALH